LIVLFTDLIDPIASQALMKSLQAFSHQHLFMIVTLSDSNLLSSAAQMPWSTQQAYQKGIAMDLLQVRHTALQAMTKHQGALIVDVPPERLDESVIHQYLQVKLRNRL
nr:hypothetical protein [Vampirovibrio sp.]